MSLKYERKEDKAIWIQPLRKPTIFVVQKNNATGLWANAYSKLFNTINTEQKLYKHKYRDSFYLIIDTFYICWVCNINIKFYDIWKENIIKFHHIHKRKFTEKKKCLHSLSHHFWNCMDVQRIVVHQILIMWIITSH
jgi:hypothetical protein